MKNNMAYFDEKSGEIILSQEDKKMFQEINLNIQNHKTPISDSIMKKILNGVDSHNSDKNRLKTQF